MNEAVNELISRDMVIPIIALGVGGLIAIVAIVSTSIRAIAVGRAREQTKREMAAFVAEGSIDPDKAVAMINAGRPHWETGQKLAQGKGGYCGT